MIVLIGSEGAQGKRYQAILKYLGVEFSRVDLDVYEINPNPLAGIIVCSPTDTHVEKVRTIIRDGVRVPILVEKPFTKDLAYLKALAPEIESSGVPISIVMQYRHLLGPGEGESFYNYFRHGNDGLVWDCLQTVALARGSVSLAETSPIWQCQINGHPLNIADMDKAYVLEVKDWLSGRRQSFSEIIDIHEKVKAYADAR